MQLCKMLRVERADLYAVMRGPTKIRGERVLSAIARVFPGELGIKSIKQRVANL